MVKIVEPEINSGGEEEKPSFVIVKCPRCGEDVQIDEGGNEDIEHCDNCEDWTQCEHCNEWTAESNAVNTRVSGGQQWCDDCCDNHAFFCSECEETHDLPSAETVYTNSRRTSSVEMCQECASSNSFTCNECEERYHDNVDHEIIDDETVCNSCVENNYWHCEDCNCYHPTDEACPNNDEPEGDGSVFTAKRGYGGHGSFKIVSLKGAPAIGMEMEVGEITRSYGMNDVWGKDRLDEHFSYPTADGSLAESGVEFIGHPWDIWKHLSEYPLYQHFFASLLACGGTVETRPSGCHMNVHVDAFGGEDGVRAAVVAANRFHKALLLMTPEEMHDKRIHYAHAVEFKSGRDPMELIKDTGKYSIANYKSGDSILEFRIPAMTLDINRFFAQLQLYHNLVVWSRSHTYDDAALATFDNIFLPVLFQDKIEDVVKAGRAINPICAGDPDIIYDFELRTVQNEVIMGWDTEPPVDEVLRYASSNCFTYGVGAKLDGLDISTKKLASDLRYCIFNKCRAHKTQFSGVGLYRSSFNECDLSEAVVMEGNWNRAAFNGCNMDGFKMAGDANLRETQFYKNSLRGATFTMQIRGSTFRECDLRGAVFPTTLSIRDVAFIDCNLEGAVYPVPPRIPTLNIAIDDEADSSFPGTAKIVLLKGGREAYLMLVEKLRRVTDGDSLYGTRDAYDEGDGIKPGDVVQKGAKFGVCVIAGNIPGGLFAVLRPDYRHPVAIERKLVSYVFDGTNNLTVRTKVVVPTHGIADSVEKQGLETKCTKGNPTWMQVQSAFKTTSGELARPGDIVIDGAVFVVLEPGTCSGTFQRYSGAAKSGKLGGASFSVNDEIITYKFEDGQTFSAPLTQTDRT